MRAVPPPGPVVFTPDSARTALQRLSPVQRELDPAVVASYAKDMAEGLWARASSTVRFDGEGRLANGQHRLRAVVASGRCVVLVVGR